MGTTTTILSSIFSFCITLFPFVFIAIFNISITIKLHVHRNGSNTRQVPTSSVSAMVLAIVVAYLLLYFPIVLCHIVARIMSESLQTTQITSLYIAGQVAGLLVRVNCAINFILYVFLCKTFLNEAKKMFSSCRRTRRVQSEDDHEDVERNNASSPDAYQQAWIALAET